MHAPLTCPSAQPNMADAQVIGVISGNSDEPRIAYFKKAVAIDLTKFDLGVLDPTEVFRFAGRCEEAGCVQFSDGRCDLAQRIVNRTDPVSDSLPSCTIRRSCRWHHEHGAQACLRCAQVITLFPQGNDKLSLAASLPKQEKNHGNTEGGVSFG